MRRNEMKLSTRLLLLALAAPVVFASAAAGADDDWSLCGAGFQVPERPVSEAAESDGDSETIHLSADEAEVVEDGVSRLTGNVAVGQGTRQLRSDEIVYNQSEAVIEARGNVRFWDEGVFVTGERARAEIEQDVITIEPATAFMLEDEHGHGDAAEIKTLGNERMTANDVTYTTCNPGDADWRITASRVEFDRTKDAGTARNAWLEFKGQRVFYLPWISFPLSSQRKSGFLAPTYGTGPIRRSRGDGPLLFQPCTELRRDAHRASDEGARRAGAGRIPLCFPSLRVRPGRGALSAVRREVRRRSHSVRPRAPAPVVGPVVDEYPLRVGLGRGVSRGSRGQPLAEQPNAPPSPVRRQLPR